jgi:hypothetical protein
MGWFVRVVFLLAWIVAIAAAAGFVWALATIGDCDQRETALVSDLAALHLQMMRSTNEQAAASLREFGARSPTWSDLWEQTEYHWGPRRRGLEGDLAINEIRAGRAAAVHWVCVFTFWPAAVIGTLAAIGVLIDWHLSGDAKAAGQAHPQFRTLTPRSDWRYPRGLPTGEETRSGGPDDPLDFLRPGPPLR